LIKAGSLVAVKILPDGHHSGEYRATLRRGFVVTAAEIAAALGGASREGRDWRCRCPLHSGRSLTLRDGRTALLALSLERGARHGPSMSRAGDAAASALFLARV
jgi:hypothetical protein